MSTHNAPSPGFGFLDLSPKAWISVGIFLTLFVLVLVTREDRVAVGLRTLELPTLDENLVEKIEVKGEHRALLAKGESGWTVADPDKPDTRFGADPSAVSALLSSLKELEAGSFVTARKEKHADLEIDDEKGLFVTFHQKGRAPLALVFGRYAQGGGNYIRLASGTEVFVGKGTVGAKLKKNVEGWRKKKLFDLELAGLASLTVEPAGGQAFTLEPREEGEEKKIVWGVAPGTALPEGFRVDDELARRLATNAVGLRASAFVDEPRATLDTGLGDPPVLGRLVLKTKEGKSYTLRLGKEDEASRVHASIEGEAQIYLLTSHQAKGAMKALDELRDLTLARFEASQVERIQVRGAEGSLELAKQEGTWTLVAPQKTPDGFELDPSRVEGFLASLTRLKGTERFAAPPAGHGTDRPSTSVTLTLTDGSTKTLAFGRPLPGDEAGKKVYVQGAEEPVVYAIGEYQKTRLDKPLELVKKLPPPPSPPPGMGGGGIPGLENLPPDVRQKLEESLREQGLPGR